MVGLRIFAPLALLLAGVASQDTGNHPEWPRWCGKVYKPEYGAPQFHHHACGEIQKQSVA